MVLRLVELSVSSQDGTTRPRFHEVCSEIVKANGQECSCTIRFGAQSGLRKEEMQADRPAHPTPDHVRQTSVTRWCPGQQTVGLRGKRQSLRERLVCLLSSMCSGQHQENDATDSRASYRGRLVQDKKTKQPRLNCRNWECGVVVPMPVLKAGEDEQGSSRTTSMDVFTGHVPIPMQVPGTFYGSKTPWFNTQPEA